MALEFKLNLPLTGNLSTAEEADLVFDVAILGGGPAGMTAAVYALRKQMSVVMISPDLGGQVLKTSGVENYMGYQYITGPELSSKFSEQIQKFPIKLLQGESVTSLSQSGDKLFTLTTDGERTLRSRTLILATGKRWRKLNVPGEDTYLGHGVVYCAVCDAPFFKGLPVVVAGGGNSAVTGALDMIRLNSPVTLVNYAPGWQADPVLLDQVKGRATLLDNHYIVEVLGDGQVVTGVKLVPRAGGEEKILPAQGVFVEIGLLPNTEVFKNFVDLNAENEVVVDHSAHTSREGVYGAGDCTSITEKQIIIAAGDGAKAALAAYQHLLYARP